jgi:hypothetical protein
VAYVVGREGGLGAALAHEAIHTVRLDFTAFARDFPAIRREHAAFAVGLEHTLQHS